MDPEEAKGGGRLEVVGRGVGDGVEFSSSHERGSFSRPSWVFKAYVYMYMYTLWLLDFLDLLPAFFLSCSHGPSVCRMEVFTWLANHMEKKDETKEEA